MLPWVRNWGDFMLYVFVPVLMLPRAPPPLPAADFFHAIIYKEIFFISFILGKIDGPDL